MSDELFLTHRLTDAERQQLLQQALRHDSTLAARSRVLGRRRLHVFDLPFNLMCHILLATTISPDPLKQLSICARVHREFRRVVMVSPLYATCLLNQPERRARLLWKLRLATPGRSWFPWSKYLWSTWSNKKSLDLSWRADVEYRCPLPSEDDWDSDDGDPSWDSQDELEQPPMRDLRVGDIGGRAYGALLQALDGRCLDDCAELILSDCGLSAAGFDPIARGLRIHAGSDYCKLQDILVNNNPLGDAGASALADSLPATLCFLSVPNIGCGDIGMTALAKALPRTSIRALDCNANDAIGDAGWEALALTLPKLATLQDLNISHCCGLKCSGMSKLVRGLVAARSLRRFGAYNCAVGVAGLRTLAESVLDWTAGAPTAENDSDDETLERPGASIAVTCGHLDVEKCATIEALFNTTVYKFKQLRGGTLTFTYHHKEGYASANGTSTSYQWTSLDSDHSEDVLDEDEWSDFDD